MRISKINLITTHSIFVLFEKPIHCYKSTTFYSNDNKLDNECDTNMQYLNSDFFINEKYFLYEWCNTMLQ